MRVLYCTIRAVWRPWPGRPMAFRPAKQLKQNRYNAPRGIWVLLPVRLANRDCPARSRAYLAGRSTSAGISHTKSLPVFRF